MKNDLATAIIAAITGVLLAYFISNMVIGNFAKSSDKVKNVDSTVSSDLADPDEEVFNYKALNPTVEVYVGDCTETNMYGECVDESSEQIDQSILEEEGSDNNSNNNSSNSRSNSSSNSDNSSQNKRNRQNGSSD